ncbi:hypothetical protein A3Q56_02861 [Intoshia linei]|uniref:Uncharacterized protein n=1 Tax=Intoshia linei TaxID=1819745 RepID=A0A177B4Y4_9BILA|nr:hypothetical protein A3Q56_02861 [Intoshia linei]
MSQATGVSSSQMRVKLKLVGKIIMFSRHREIMTKRFLRVVSCMQIMKKMNRELDTDRREFVENIDMTEEQMSTVEPLQVDQYYVSSAGRKLPNFLKDYELDNPNIHTLSTRCKLLTREKFGVDKG